MRVLMIDDEPSRATSLFVAQSELMSTGAFTPIISMKELFLAHGFEQVSYYMKQQWDIILLDGDMPLMDGVDVVKTFLVEKSIPVVIISNNEPKAKQMEAILEEYEVPSLRCPITAPKNVLRSMRMLLRLLS